MVIQRVNSKGLFNLIKRLNKLLGRTKEPSKKGQIVIVSGDFKLITIKLSHENCGLSDLPSPRHNISIILEIQIHPTCKCPPTISQSVKTFLLEFIAHSFGLDIILRIAKSWSLRVFYSKGPDSGQYRYT